MKTVLLTLSVMFAALMFSNATQAATLSDILEQAAYQQETANNPERAIQLYKQVIESENATREMSAQALYNTGLCYAKLKRNKEADQAFGAVVSQYRNVEPYYRLANAQLNPAYTPSAPHWQDGERLEYEIRAKNDDQVRNYFWTTTTRTNWNGHATWKLLNRSLGNNGLSMVIVDEASLRPLYSRAYNPAYGDANATWTNHSIEIAHGDQDTPTAVQLDGVVYDSEENFWLMRQMPMSVGTKIRYQLLPSILTDKTIPVEIEVVGEEQVQVPAGQFTAYKLATNNGLTNIWIDKGPERYLLKIATPTSSHQLKSVSAVTPGATRTVTSSLTNFDIAIPDEWFSVVRQGDRKQSGTKTVNGKSDSALVTTPKEDIHLIDDDTKLKVQISIIDTRPLQGYDNFDLSLAGRTADWMQSAQKQLNGYAERTESKTDSMIAKLPALSSIVDFRERGKDWVLYATSTIRDGKFVWIGCFAPKDVFSTKKAAFDKMLSTVTF